MIHDGAKRRMGGRVYHMSMTRPVGRQRRWMVWGALAALAGGGWACAEVYGEAAEPGEIAVREHAVTCVPISRELGLSDIMVALDEAAPEVSADVSGIGRLALHRVAAREGDHRAWYGVRVMRPGTGTGSGERIAFAVRVVDASGAAHELGSFEMNGWPDPKQETPDWAKGAVWYQIFPERFFNGNPGNDPGGPWTYAPGWTSDWLTVTPDELDAARARGSARTFEIRKSGEHATGAFRDVVFDRRYGGDLQGVERKLAYIRGLGATAIYLNPIFHAESSHKYDATDYRHIDPTFGDPGDQPTLELPVGETSDPASWTWTPADRYFVDRFLPACKGAGVRVVLDGVWNHVGTRHWAFADVVRKGKDSPYAHWFQVEFADEKTYPDWKTRVLDLAPGRLVSWRAWNGRNGGLPSFSRDHDRLHPDVEKHIFDVTRRWMDPDGDGDPRDGIDGWRLDVAMDVPMGFWQAWRAHVKSINRDAVLQAEVWFDGRAYFDGRAFDGQMNYPFTDAVLAFVGRHPKADAAWLADRLSGVFSHGPQNDLVQMNLLGSHDTERLLTRIDRLVHDPKAEVNQPAAPSRVDTPPTALSRRLSVLGVALQVACPGAPMVYAGDEMGMWGGNDPDCRRPLPWPELGAQQNAALAADAGALTAAYRSWLTLRQHPIAGPVLRYGSMRMIESGEPDVFILERQVNRVRVLVVVNRGDTPWDARAHVADGFEPLPARGLENDIADAANVKNVGGVSARAWVRSE